MKVDGIEFNVGDKILLVEQHPWWVLAWRRVLSAMRIRKYSSNNGVYTVTSTGTGETPFTNDDMAVSEAIDELLELVSSDNDIEVSELNTTPENMASLERGLIRMRASGFEFTSENLSELASGEESECAELFSKYDGFWAVNEALNNIFDGEPQDTRKSVAIEYDSDYGVDRRSGWTLKIDGVVVVQFVGFFRMVSAYIKYRK